MHRLNNFDSDHFIMFISLQYEAKAHTEQESLHLDAADVEEAEKKKE
jgi:hypothetical protein